MIVIGGRKRTQYGTALAQTPPEHEAGSTSCGILDCWVYGIVGTAVGIGAAALIATLIRKAAERRTE